MCQCSRSSGSISSPRNLSGVHPTANMMAGNRHAGAFVIAFAVALLCLSLLAVIRTHWKTRQPVPQKSITGMLLAPTR